MAPAMRNELQHRTVLLEEAVNALITRADGVYVDGTFGRGGHSRLVLERLGEAGRLIAFDKDPLAIATAQQIADPRFEIVHESFASLRDAMSERGVGRVSGVLLDLGVSSPQFDDPERGFSLRADGPLDMRMDPTRGETAAEWLAGVNERELRGVIADYGEERFAQQIARAIIAARAHEPIQRTGQLAAIVAKAVGTRGRGDRSQDPATRTFQALRIHVNQELTELSLALERVLPRLALGGRLAIISFHSLEDRPVKQFFRRHALAYGGDVRLARLAIATRTLPVPPLKLIGRAIRPGDAEIAANPRARSAHLRVAERTEGTLAAW